MRRISRRLKRSTKQYIMVCIIAVVICGGAAAGISARIIKDVKAESDKLVNEYRSEMEANKQTVYILDNDILAGEVLSESNLTRKTVYASQPSDIYIDKDDIGKTSLVNIKSGTQILKSMVTDVMVNDNIREVEFDTIIVSSNIVSNDIVDIRIVFPNGEDYTILAKKTIKGYTPDAVNCFLWLDEEELLRTQSAIVDAFLYTGSYLYTTKYIEPNLQDATVVNYEPSVEAISLIQENPNIVETASNELSIMVRQALENRLSASMNKNIKENQWELENNYIYQEFPKDLLLDENISPSPIEQNLNEDEIEKAYDESISNSYNKSNKSNESDDVFVIPDKIDIDMSPEMGDSTDDLDIINEEVITYDGEVHFPELGKINDIEIGADLGNDTKDTDYCYIDMEG